MQCIRADVSVGTIQMKTPALLKHSRLVIYVTEIALGTETSYVHIRVRNESKRYPDSKRMRFTMREGSVMSWKPRKCVIAGLVTTGPGGGLFATAMTSYRLFTYMF